jgi:S-adenosylmethionine decarboxylase
MTEKTKRSIQWVIGANQKNKFKYAGIHLLAEFWHPKTIEDKEDLKKILIAAAKEANSIPLGVKIYSFSPQGITGVVLLAESHIAIHSWPEFDYLAVDIFTCGDKSIPDKALEYLKKKFEPKRVEIKKIKRGTI